MKIEIDKKLYGNCTPMAEAFEEALRIFEVNKHLHEEDTDKVLIIFSDGDYNTKCPDSIVETLKSEPYNFTISACYLQENSKNVRTVTSEHFWQQEIE